MDDTVHVDVEVVGFEAGRVGFRGVEGHADRAGLGGEVDAFFEDILDDFGVFFGEPTIKGWDSHDCFLWAVGSVESLATIDGITIVRFFYTRTNYEGSKKYKREIADAFPFPRGKTCL